MQTRTTAATHRRRPLRPVLPLLVTLLAVSLVSTSAASAVADVPPNGAWFGAYVQARGRLDQYESLRRLEHQLDRKVRIVARYHGFSDRDFGFERTVAKSGHIPMVSWRATDSRPDVHRARKIANGRYDANIRKVADIFKNIYGRVLVRFNWEMDQDPGKRQYIGRPRQFIAAWRHVVRIFRSRYASNVEFVWAPRARSFNHGDGQRFYPGDRWVDWIGGSAVPIDAWDPFGLIFRTFYRWSASHGKPILVYTGVREKPRSSMWKADWIDTVHHVVKSKMPKVKALVYYHGHTPLGFKYYADTTRQALHATRRMALDPYFMPA